MSPRDSIPHPTPDDYLQCWSTRQQEQVAQIHAHSRGYQNPSAWSCMNLLAIPTSDSKAISLTHFGGTPIVVDGLNRSKLSIILPLPEQEWSRISHLSFSPCGSYLMVVQSAARSDFLRVFEQQNGCIDQWVITWKMELGNLGDARMPNKRAINLRWIGEPAKWYPTTNDPTRPLFEAPLRSYPIAGIACIFILSSVEVLYLHFSRDKPTKPDFLVLPLYVPQTASPHTTSLQSQATPSAVIPSPQTGVEDLVANLVDGIAANTPSPSSFPTHDSTSGMAALKEELSAQSRRDAGVNYKVKSGAIGIARTDTKEYGTTTMLIATSCIDIGQTPVAAAPAKKKELENDPNNFFDFSMGFSDLDSAFDSVQDAKPTLSDRGERKIELAELKIKLSAMNGPRISIRPLEPLFVTDPDASNESAGGVLTHLTWLENVSLQENEADLRLLVSLSSESVEGRFYSTLTSWNFSYAAYELCETFSSLECKKQDISKGELEWTWNRIATRCLPGLMTALADCGTSFSTFLVGYVNDVSGSTEAELLDLNTLLNRSPQPIKLPGPSTYSSLSLSCNNALICATIFDSTIASSKPLLMAVPLGQTEDGILSLATKLSICLLQQRDPSDLIGQILSLTHADIAAPSIFLRTAKQLQEMLAHNVLLHNSPLQLELLGIIYAVYSAIPVLNSISQLPYSILQLAGCHRAFKKSFKSERKMVPGQYRCDGDSIWPLLGYLTWFCDFSRDLVTECRTPMSLDGSHPAAFIMFLHPLPRTLLVQNTRYVLALQAFLASFKPNTNIVVDLARSVCDDVIEYGGLVMSEFGLLVDQIGGLVPAGDTSELQSLLINFTIAPLSPSAGNIPLVGALLASSTLLLESINPSVSNEPHANEKSEFVDIIRRCRITADRSVKKCTKCRGESLRKDLHEMDSRGRWTLFEMGWDSRCFCGGLWF